MIPWPKSSPAAACRPLYQVRARCRWLAGAPAAAGTGFYCAVLEGSCRILHGDGRDEGIACMPAISCWHRPAGFCPGQPALRGPSWTKINPRRACPTNAAWAARGRQRYGWWWAIASSTRPTRRCCCRCCRTCWWCAPIRAWRRWCNWWGRIAPTAGARNGLSRLLEVLLIEALRSSDRYHSASPRLLRGLADARLAMAIALPACQPCRAWNMARLAREARCRAPPSSNASAAKSGVAPMQYLLAWRMALAKRLLREQASLVEVAQQVGYSSASTFSVAFSRHVGLPPSLFAQRQRSRRLQAQAAQIPPAPSCRCACSAAARHGRSSCL
jgi:AraC-like DNA-binding protein